jgi:hypothetical protein
METQQTETTTHGQRSSQRKKDRKKRKNKTKLTHPVIEAPSSCDTKGTLGKKIDLLGSIKSETKGIGS